jgi:hypothetical protein
VVTQMLAPGQPLAGTSSKDLKAGLAALWKRYKRQSNPAPAPPVPIPAAPASPVPPALPPAPAAAEVAIPVTPPTHPCRKCAKPLKSLEGRDAHEIWCDGPKQKAPTHQECDRCNTEIAGPGWVRHRLHCRGVGSTPISKKQKVVSPKYPKVACATFGTVVKRSNANTLLLRMFGTALTLTLTLTLSPYLARQTSADNHTCL